MDFWQLLSDRKIEEAQQSGEFDTSGYWGKPLDLTENPFVPEDQRLAFKLMKDNDLVPAWIGDGKEIRETISRAIQRVERAHATFQATLRRLESRIDVEAIYAREDAYRAWDKARERFHTDGAQINRLINTYNLRVPISDLQRLYFNVERELDRIQNGKPQR
jgi:hypothetical protein